MMLPFLQNLFGLGGAGAGAAGASIAAMPGTVGPQGLVPPVGAPMDLGAMAKANPNPEIMFDPTLGKVVPGSLTPGAPQGGPPMPMPKPSAPYGGPDMPPMARGAPSAPQPEAPPQSPLQAAIQNQFSNIGSGEGTPSAPNQFAAMGSGGGAGGMPGGIPLLQFLQANGMQPPKYRTGGSF